MNWHELSTAAWGVLLLAAFIQGIAKAGLPGLSILAVPLVAHIIPGKNSTGLVLPMLLLGDLFAVAYWRRSANWRDILRALPWALGGIVVGYFLLGTIQDHWMRPIIGGIILIILVLHLTHQRLRAALANFLEKDRSPDMTRPPSDGKIGRHLFAAFMGTAGGVTTMLANAAGPVMSLYFLALRLPKATFLGTSAWYFLIVNWCKVPFMLKLDMITRESLKMNAIMAPALIAGAMLGIHVARRLPEKAFTTLVLILTGLSAIRLLIDPLL